jgi:hypothetical protein
MSWYKLRALVFHSKPKVIKSFSLIGIDIPKATPDDSILSPSDINKVRYPPFSNSKKGFVQLLKWIKQNSEGVPEQKWRVCMENTGIYSLNNLGFEAQRVVDNPPVKNNLNPLLPH